MNGEVSHPVPLSTFPFQTNLNPLSARACMCALRDGELYKYEFTNLIREHCRNDPKITNQTRDRLLLSGDQVFQQGGWGATSAVSFYEFARVACKSPGFIQLLKEVGLYRESRAKKSTRSMKKAFAFNSFKVLPGKRGDADDTSSPGARSKSKRHQSMEELMRSPTPTGGSRRGSPSPLQARSPSGGPIPPKMAAAAGKRAPPEDARYMFEAAEHAKSRAWIPAGTPARAAAEARLRASDAAAERAASPMRLARSPQGRHLNRHPEGEGGPGGRHAAAAWMRELRASGSLFTPRTAEYRVWDGAVAVTRDAEDLRGTGQGYASNLDPVLHHGGFRSEARMRPGAASVSFAHRKVAHARPDSRMSHGSLRKEFKWPEFR